MDRIAILICGHGSRDAAANAEFEQLVAAYQRRHPEFAVRHGYIELAAPALADALRDAARDASQVIVIPLFLFAAGHVKNDIPIAIQSARADFPQIQFSAARALGVHPALAALAYDRADAAAHLNGHAARTAMIVVGRGSSDPDANGDFCKLVRILSENRGLGWVLPSFIGVTRPSFEETIELVARARPEQIVVVPYFLFSGRLIEKLHEQTQAFRQRYPWIRTDVAAHLGVNDSLLNIIDERVNEALVLDGASPMPCDNCQYRTPLPGRAEQVGGLKAMLWSIRRNFTHTQAAPHVHAHKPIDKHVLICGNVDCAERGSIALLETLRRKIHDAGRDQTIRVTRTSCMGRCGEGPTVAVYPDGVWYRGVQEHDAADLLNEHLLNDRLVARLVDNIMV